MLVIFQHFGVVHLVYMVAGEYKYIFGIVLVYELHILVYGVGSTLVPVRGMSALIGRKDLHTAESAVKIPRKSVADIVVEHKGLILGQHAHRIYTRVRAV